MSTKNTIVDEGHRVIIYDELAESVIYDTLGFPDDESGEAGEDAFKEQFELVKSVRGFFLANPRDVFYQGVDVMRVIRRKSDGALFGFQYWTPIAKHTEAVVEPNGDEHGFEFDVPDGFDWDNDYYPAPYVFLPIEPFTIVGYKFLDGDE